MASLPSTPISECGGPILFFFELTGFVLDEVKRQPLSIIFEPEHWSQIAEDLTQAIRNEKALAVDIPIKSKKRNKLWVALHATPIVGPDKKVSQYFIIFREITARKEQAAQLMLFKSLMDQSSDAIQVARADGSMVYINQVASERLGIPQESIHEYTVFDFEKIFSNPQIWANHIQERTADH